MRKIISILLFILTIIILDLNNVSATSWYYSDWPYRQVILINNSVSTPEDYQVKIVFDSSNIDYSKTNDDGSDLRFSYYHAGSENEVSYWIEKWDEAGESIIWIKAPKIEGIYYVYYGNGDIGDESNGENTFEFFDNFDEWYGDDWGIKPDCASLENSILTLTTNNSECGLLSKTIFGVDYSLIIKFKDNVKGVGNQQATWTGWWRNDNLVLAQLHSWSPDEKFWFETKIHPSANSYVTDESTDTDWHVVEIRRNSTNSPVFTLDDKYLWDNSPDKPTHDLGVRLRYLSYSGYSGGASFDYVFVRKYSFPEPGYVIGGIEAQEPPGLISTEVENLYTGSIHDILKEFFTAQYIDVMLTTWISRDDLVGSVGSNFSAEAGILIPGEIPMGRIEEGKYSGRYGVASALEIVQRLVGFLVSYLTSGTELLSLGFQPDVRWDYVIVNATWGDSYPYLVDKRLPTVLEGLPIKFAGRATMFITACPVDMLVIDPEGKRTGSLYENGEFVGIVNEIERSAYTGRGTEPEFVVIFDPIEGEYRIQIYGNETGSYNFSVISMDNGSVFYGKNYTNILIGQGEVHIYYEPITDTEPPEAVIDYDLLSEELVVEGRDNFDKDVDVTYEEECSKSLFRICMEREREYTLTDDAGNQLILEMRYNKINHSHRDNSFSFNYARLLKAKYMAGEESKENAYERNLLGYGISKKSGRIRHFSQNVYMKGRGFVKAFYDSKKNETRVVSNWEKEPGRDVLEGMHVLKIITDSEEFIKIVR